MEKVSKHLDPDILAPNAVNVITGNDEEANCVLWMVNSRKAMQFMSDWQRSNGLAVVLQRWELGCQREGMEEQNALGNRYCCPQDFFR
jgi:hypothetical protein